MKYISVVISLSLFLFSSASFAKVEKAGTVLMALGVVSAEYKVENDETDEVEKITKKLKRRTKIFPGYIITTGPESSVQIKMTDGTLINMDADSTIDLRRYSFDKNDLESSIFDLEVVAGVIKAATGDLAGMAPDKYMLRTEAMKVTVGGTRLVLGVCKKTTDTCKKGANILRTEDGVVFALLGNGQKYTVAANDPNGNTLTINVNGQSYNVTRESSSPSTPPINGNNNINNNTIMPNPAEVIIASTSGCGGQIVGASCVVRASSSLITTNDILRSENKIVLNIPDSQAAMTTTSRIYPLDFELHRVGGMFGPPAFINGTYIGHDPNLEGVDNTNFNISIINTAYFDPENPTRPIASNYPDPNAYLFGAETNLPNMFAAGPKIALPTDTNIIIQSPYNSDPINTDIGKANDLEFRGMSIDGTRVNYGYWNNNAYPNSGSFAAVGYNDSINPTIPMLNRNVAEDTASANQLYHWYVIDQNMLSPTTTGTGTATFNQLIFFSGTDHQNNVYRNQDADIGVVANFTDRSIGWDFAITHSDSGLSWFAGSNTFSSSDLIASGDISHSSGISPPLHDVGINAMNNGFLGKVDNATLLDSGNSQSVFGVISGHFVQNNATTLNTSGNTNPNAVVGGINLQNTNKDAYLSGTYGLAAPVDN